MNVLLIYCDIGSPARYLRFLELGIYHQVLHDARMRVNSLLVVPESGPEEIPEVFRQQPAQLVAFYVDEFNLSASLLRAGELKTAFPDVPLCAIGIMPALGPERITRSNLFEYMIVGEGEFALYELATQVQARGEVRSIKNLWWTDGGNWNRNPLRPLLENMDQLPYSDRSLFGQEELSTPLSERALSVSASRGCMYDCQFCYSPVLKRAYGGKGAYYRVRTPQHLAGEVLSELRRADYASVVFVDEQFPTDKPWLRQLGQRFGNTDIRFQATVAIERCDAETLDLLREAGCERISLGLETGSEGFRKRISDRNRGNEQVLRFAEQLRERGIGLVITNMAGMPLESEPLLQETYSLNQQLEPEDVRCTAFVPVEGTPFHAYATDKGYITAEERPYLHFRQPRLELPELPMARQKAHLTRMHFLGILQRMKLTGTSDEGLNLLRELPRAKLKMPGPDGIDVGVVRNGAAPFAFLELQAGGECRFPLDLAAGSLLRFKLGISPASLKKITAAECRLIAEVIWNKGEEEETLFCYVFRRDEPAAVRKWRECMVPAPENAGTGELKLRVSAVPADGMDAKVFFGMPRLLDPGSQRRRSTDGDGENRSPADPGRMKELESMLEEARSAAAEARREREQKVMRIAELQERILELEKLLEQHTSPAVGDKDSGLGDRLKGIFRK